LCYLSVVKNNINEREQPGNAVWWTLIAVSSKILFEDAPELLLEYFYVDKFIVNNPPWIFVFKDVVAAFIYTIPLITILIAFNDEFKAVTEIPFLEFTHVTYISATTARVCMSLSMIFRIIGMITQYKSTTVSKECFIVSNYSLYQAPFDTGCLLWYDWIICVFLSLSVLAAIPAAVVGLCLVGRAVLTD
jgi:hypothetical protein